MFENPLLSEQARQDRLGITYFLKIRLFLYINGFNEENL
jgi:hypothetical protein